MEDIKRIFIGLLAIVIIIGFFVVPSVFFFGTEGLEISAISFTLIICAFAVVSICWMIGDIVEEITHEIREKRRLRK